MSEMFMPIEGDTDIVVNAEESQGSSGDSLALTEEDLFNENAETGQADNPVSAKTDDEYSIQYDNISDFQEEQETTVLTSNFTEETETTKQAEAGNQTNAGSDLSIIGITLTDSEKQRYFDNLTEEEGYRQEILSFLQEEQKLNETFQAFMESSETNQDDLLSIEEQLLTASLAITDNQKELAKSLKVTNTLLFAVLLGVLLLLGATFANTAWQKFR